MQKRIFSAMAAMHKHTAWATIRRAQPRLPSSRRREGLLIAAC
jgi:hypothetical protein